MSGDATPLLAVEHVSKSFPGVRALNDMHLSLRHGEVLALVGENGAGKSTLMKLLSGIYIPDEGSFTLNGAPFAPSSPKHAQELGISIIHQELNLVPDLSVAQNIFLGREDSQAGFLSDRKLNARAAALFERLGVGLDPRAIVDSLTVAEQQLVEIAKALSFQAKVIIMDEPTAALNDAEVDVLHGLIRSFISPETGVIYISHRMEELEQISQRITVIRDGEYVDTRQTSETNVKEIISLMVGRNVSTERRPQQVQGSAEVVLSVEGLSTQSLLRDVSFDLHQGEILGFAGLMGAGRTEVARALVGADKASFRALTLRSKAVQIANPAVAAQLGLGYLSEDRKRLGLMLERTVEDNTVLSSLARYTKLGFLQDRSLHQQASGYQKQLGIKTPSLAQLVRNLSGGNQQKIVIAKWLMRDCDILIFDEPTRGIDVGAKEEIYGILNSLVAEGKSVIVISSELPEILAISHRIAVMSNGRITGFLSNEEANQEKIMAYATEAGDDENATYSSQGIRS